MRGSRRFSGTRRGGQSWRMLLVSSSSVRGLPTDQLKAGRRFEPQWGTFRRAPNRFGAAELWRIRGVRALIGAAHPASWVRSAWLGPAPVTKEPVMAAVTSVVLYDPRDTSPEVRSSPGSARALDLAVGERLGPWRKRDGHPSCRPCGGQGAASGGPVVRRVDEVAAQGRTRRRLGHRRWRWRRARSRRRGGSGVRGRSCARLPRCVRCRRLRRGKRSSTVLRVEGAGPLLDRVGMALQ